MPDFQPAFRISKAAPVLPPHTLTLLNPRKLIPLHKVHLSPHLDPTFKQPRFQQNWRSLILTKSLRSKKMMGTHLYKSKLPALNECKQRKNEYLNMMKVQDGQEESGKWVGMSGEGRLFEVREINFNQTYQAKLTRWASISHDHILKLFAFQQKDYKLHLCIERQEGGTLQHLVTEFGTFPQTLTKNIIRQILTALQLLQQCQLYPSTLTPAQVSTDGLGTFKIDLGSNVQTSYQLSEVANLVFWMLNGDELPSQRTEMVSKGKKYSTECIEFMLACVEEKTDVCQLQQHRWLHTS